MDDKIRRIKELTEKLIEASEYYYAKNEEIMSNLEYDDLYDELQELELETGFRLPQSPTGTVGYSAVDQLPKEKHEKPMLSLGKTKDRQELSDWLKDKEGLLSWKLDGLTVVLTYQNGILEKAVTRGNGEIGEVVTNNAKVFKNLPKRIPYLGELILRGEAVITYSDFEMMNAAIENIENKYKNPRNLCSGSVRQLNNEITANRNVRFYAFALVKTQDEAIMNTREEQMQFLQQQGFSVVEYVKVTAQTVEAAISDYAGKIQKLDIPSDGLVLCFNDIAYGASLGTTAKAPRDSIAFKWADEKAQTHLLEIEWSPSRTGLINPVAIFETVELEGTSVSRASVHNISVMKALKLGIGDTITVYKANMIIPQIAENLTGSDNIPIPQTCPVCGGATQIQSMNQVQALYCTNPDCDAKKIKAFTLFVSRNALNIDGISEATLEKFIAKGFIHEFADIYRLDRFREEIVTMEGFGEKSYTNLMESIETSKITTLPRLIYGLGIANIGIANAKMISRYYHYDLWKMADTTEEELSLIPGVGEVIASTYVAYFQNEKNREQLRNLLQYLQLEDEEPLEQEATLGGTTFVITGTLEQFENRDALKEFIEKKGGKVTGSVTAKTTYLINNDNLSASTKNKKAKELGIPILTEAEFISKYN